MKSLVLFDFTEESLKEQPNLLHELAVPISLLSQHSWWGLVLAETYPVRWVTLYNTICTTRPWLCMKFDGAELPPVKSLVLFDFTEESLKVRSKRPNSLHELAVPISLLPQHTWWGLVWPKHVLSKWVTFTCKQLGQLFFFRMWFLDCFVTMCMHMRLAAHTQSKHHGEFANLHTQFSDIISQQNTRRKSLQSPVWVIFQFFWCPIDWQTERCFVHVQVGWKTASAQTKQCKVKGQRMLTKHCEATQTLLLVDDALLVGSGKDPPTLAQVAEWLY